MSCAVILHGPIGGGKTRTCLELSERARAEGIHPGGIISPRVFTGGKLVGYDALEPATGEKFPIVRLREMAEGPNWFTHGRLIYSFSASGFERANEILRLSAEKQDRPLLIFVDEFGRLEDSGMALYQGALRVSEAISGGVVAVYTCRTNLVAAVEGLLRGNVEETRRAEPGDTDALWAIIRGFFGP
jgi:nucleoside-triphosphatase THEP1